MNKLDKKQANHLILLCSIIYCISYITRINYKAVLLSMMTDTGFSKAQLSIALAGLFIAYGIGQLVSGYFGDRIQPKYLIAGGLITTTAMNLLIPACSSSYILMSVVWTVNGLAQAFMWPPLVKLMADQMNMEDYTRGTVRVNWGASIGTIVVYLGTAALVAWIAWQSVFFASAALAVIGLIVWLFLCPTIDLKPAVKETSAASPASKRPLILMICLLGAIVMMGILRDGVDTFMPVYIDEQYHLGDAISILAGVAMPVFALICQQLAGVLFNKVFKDAFRSAFFIFIFGTLAATVLYFVNRFNGNVILSIFLLALLTGCMHGVNMNLICILPPILAGNGKVSAVSGLLNSFTYVGSAISMYVIPMIAENADWSVTILMWIGFAGLGTVLNLLCLPIWKKYRNTLSS